MARLSDGRPLFHDRWDAGRRLAKRLEQYRTASPIVCAIPRGGVPVGAAIAEHLDAALDVVVARKLGAPLHPEIAIGAVAADGAWFLNQDLFRPLHVDRVYLEQVARQESAEAQRQERWLRRGRPIVDVTDRTVLLVDDGLATGATMRAAARSLRTRAPRQVVVAVPVGARSACAELQDDVDEVVCLATPDPFYAVGMYYDHFDQVEDTEVWNLLANAARGAGHPGSAGPVLRDAIVRGREPSGEYR